MNKNDGTGHASRPPRACRLVVQGPYGRASRTSFSTLVFSEHLICVPVTLADPSIAPRDPDEPDVLELGPQSMDLCEHRSQMRLFHSPRAIDLVDAELRVRMDPHFPTVLGHAIIQGLEYCRVLGYVVRLASDVHRVFDEHLSGRRVHDDPCRGGGARVRRSGSTVCVDVENGVSGFPILLGHGRVCARQADKISL